jgi:hypothetical protein
LRNEKVRSSYVEGKKRKVDNVALSMLVGASDVTISTLPKFELVAFP